ncbi:YdiK family protein [Bacillus massiliglaciei]|uniref:YdiK family protein n=1 Tax=Bacillus massiliglaciei TaxID=1816693 RepID=UPI000DA60165|nr:YdiK family protein [Bacillus massiliglaciei]
MRRSPLTMGMIYVGLGVLFTFMAIQRVSNSGWGFFAYLLIVIATLDFGSGIRMLLLHLKIKSIKKNQKK